MGRAIYKVVETKDGWGVSHGGSVSGSYMTKEAAFEAAVGPASNAIKDGHAVQISVEGSAKDEPALSKT
jgi:hypothetical protein